MNELKVNTSFTINLYCMREECFHFDSHPMEYIARLGIFRCKNCGFQAIVKVKQD
ncbi:MAG: hypothetical protein ACFFDN_45110 [Candidatus Hodarchaeota archaeon]